MVRVLVAIGVFVLACPACTFLLGSDGTASSDAGPNPIADASTDAPPVCECPEGVCDGAICIPNARIAFVSGPGGASDGDCFIDSPCVDFQVAVDAARQRSVSHVYALSALPDQPEILIASTSTPMTILANGSSFSGPFDRLLVLGDSEVTVRDATFVGSASNMQLILVQASSTLTLDSVSVEDAPSLAVSITQGSTLNFERSRAVGAAGTALQSINSTIAVRSSSIENNDIGISATNSSVVVEASRVLGNTGDGIIVSGGTAIVRDSYVAGNARGINLISAEINTLSFSTFANESNLLCTNDVSLPAGPKLDGNIVLGIDDPECGVLPFTLSHAPPNDVSFAAPLFGNEHHLVADSPGIDDPRLTARPGQLDADGNIRANPPDLGAFEYLP